MPPPGLTAEPILMNGPGRTTFRVALGLKLTLYNPEARFGTVNVNDWDGAKFVPTLTTEARFGTVNVNDGLESTTLQAPDVAVAGTRTATAPLRGFPDPSESVV